MRWGADSLLLGMERQAQAYLDSPKLESLIAWADRETQNSESNFKRAVKCSLAVSLALDHTLVFDHVIIIDFACALGHDRDCVIDLIRTHDLSHDRALNLSHAFEKIKIFRSVDFPYVILQLEELKSRKPCRNLDHHFAGIWCQALHLYQ
jgi:hypothetical protein